MTSNPARYLQGAISPDQIVACIGLVSDTHMPQRCAEFPPALFDVLDGVDLLLHAGDVGELWVLDRLSAIAPVIAVHGNDETSDAENALPYSQVVTVAGQRILLWHSHYPDWQEEMASRKDDDLHTKLARSIERAKQTDVSVVVFGHWHIPLVYRRDGVCVINPGALASGNEISRQLHQTVALLFILDTGEVVVAHVDLADPNRPFDTSIDFDAGFTEVFRRFSRSILDPTLTAVIPYLRQTLPPDQVDELRELVLRLARQCWIDEVPVLTLKMLIAEVERSEEVTEETKQVVRNYEFRNGSRW